MSDDQPSAKWQAKQRAAQEAEAKFAANQARAQQRQGKRRGAKAELDDVGAALGKVDVKVGLLGWLVAHKAVLGVLVVLLGGGVIFTMCKIVKYRLRNAPGTPTGELMVGDTLILLDHVAVGGTDSKGRAQQETASGQRLTAVDAATGAQLAVDVGDYKACHRAGTRVACIDVQDRLELLDPRTLAVTHTAADLITAAKLAKPTRRIEREGESFTIVLEDGRGARIDPGLDAPTVTALDSVPSQMVFPARSGCETSAQTRLGAVTLKFEDGGTRARLTSDPPPPAESATPSGPALTFLEPGFLAVGAPVVLHRATLGDKVDHVVSRVEGVSRERWRAPLAGECRRTYVHAETLIVTTGNPERRALGIELGSGRVAWTFGR